MNKSFVYVSGDVYCRNNWRTRMKCSLGELVMRFRAKSRLFDGTRQLSNSYPQESDLKGFPDSLSALVVL